MCLSMSRAMNACSFVAITSLLLQLQSVVVDSNHYMWWTCTAECHRCVRRTTPMERWISDYYSGLFSPKPPVSFYDSNGKPEVNSGANPSYPDSSDSESGNPSNNSHNPGNHNYGCCETEYGHWAPNRTNYNSKRYTVVHLRHMYQFVPVGRCKKLTTCLQGQCVQILRAHWVLVYDDKKNSLGPPVTFVPIKIPSHCECLNIGRARP
ncbi:uncharacterized protein LOC121380628 isoform X2 [Gigantopelta aegis]|uniref:uncharacterized protein LOC121380628 isoform X2 n=1 Tax=Gigantopelta aegis TaxID=1735272 RepID=UPI001B8878AD|nr:uncharacterized protein LOC121380628 isoform X2 [Gigantopelta aegis]